MKDQEKQQSTSFGRQIGKALAEEGRTWARWAGSGAVVGGIVPGGVGLNYCGFEGLAVGAAVGAVIGAIGAWVFYIQASTF